MDIAASTKRKQRRVRVFCCYAPEDQKWFVKLKNCLVPVQRDGLITLWANADIPVGTDKEQENRRHLNTSRIILLLVSIDFIASEDCYTEMTQAIKRHNSRQAQVIPIIVGSCDWQKEPFGKLKVLPKDTRPIAQRSEADQDEIFTNVAREVRNAAIDFLKKEEQIFLEEDIEEISDHKQKSAKKSFNVKNYHMLPLAAKKKTLLPKSRATLKQQTRWPRIVAGLLLLGLALVLFLEPEARMYIFSSFSPSLSPSPSLSLSPSPSLSLSPSPSPSPLIPSAWTVQLNDPLLASRHQTDWETDGCTFSGPGRVFEHEASDLDYCNYGESANHAWGDLAYQAQVAIHQGDWAGLIMRLKSHNYYYFEISRSGAWDFEQHFVSKDGKTVDDISIQHGSSAVIHSGFDQWNTLLIVTQGNTFTLWINGQQVAASFSVPSLIPAGTIGVIVGKGDNISCTSWFRNALLRAP